VYRLLPTRQPTDPRVDQPRPTFPPRAGQPPPTVRLPCRPTTTQSQPFKQGGGLIFFTRPPSFFNFREIGAHMGSTRPSRAPHSATELRSPTPQPTRSPTLPPTSTPTSGLPLYLLPGPMIYRRHHPRRQKSVDRRGFPPQLPQCQFGDGRPPLRD
jgi:hypothetical protein